MSAIQPTYVIGYAPSGRGDDALALGLALGELAGAFQIVATVVPWRGELMDLDRRQRLVAGDTARLRLEIRDRLTGHDWEARTILRDSAAQALAELAEHESAQLIVLGGTRHGRGGRALLGSTTESVLGGAPCAVAVAPHGYARKPGRGLENIAVAFDGSAESERALEAAIGIAEPLGARITLCAVAGAPRYGYREAWETISRGECETRDERRKRRMLERRLRWMPAGTRAGARVVVGVTGATLADLSAGFDLMLVGSRGYGPLRRTVLGSATRRLLAEGRCPVIVTPRGSSGEPLRMRGGVRENGSVLGAGPGLGAD
ncbi:universal stress protein [Thermoleophilia bacterium SCSIO 60948]|nr:universal stress protein [Thermoleophilia bacterium SCSIO 60948]